VSRRKKETLHLMSCLLRGEVRNEEHGVEKRERKVLFLSTNVKSGGRGTMEKNPETKRKGRRSYLVWRSVLHRGIRWKGRRTKGTRKRERNKPL